MKIEFKKECLNGTDPTLDIITLLLSDVYQDSREDIFKDKRIFITKSLQFSKNGRIDRLKNIYMDYFSNKEKRRFTLENININDIIKNSKYEPLSYHFIMDFFKQIFGGDYLSEFHKPSNYIVTNRDNLWILKTYFIDFLNLVTNISDLRKEFLDKIDKMIEEKTKIDVIHDLNEVFIYYIVYESFPFSHGRIREEIKLESFNYDLADGRIFIISLRNREVVENTYVPTSLFYLPKIVRMVSLANTQNNLFL